MVEGETEYILVCLVKEESFLVCAQMAVCQIRNLVMSFAEQFDRNNFMQNIILGNMLIVDIYGKAKKHHISGSTAGMIFVSLASISPGSISAKNPKCPILIPHTGIPF